MVLLADERYESIKQLVANVIQGTNVNKYPLNMLWLLNEFDIKVSGYQQLKPSKERECFLASDDAFSIDEGGIWRVYYNMSLKPTRIRFSLAHELGHILLNHQHQAEDDFDESEANFFAKYLLAPPCIIQEEARRGVIRCQTDISIIFGLGDEMTMYVSNYYYKWLRNYKIKNYYEDYEQQIKETYFKNTLISI